MEEESLLVALPVHREVDDGVDMGTLHWENEGRFGGDAVVEEEEGGGYMVDWELVSEKMLLVDRELSATDFGMLAVDLALFP
jgi:hypothetical protein